MAWAALAIPIASALLGAAGNKKAGDASAAQAEAQTKQYYAAAGQSRAVAQRQAIEARRQAALINSRQQAVAAASGAGAADPTVVSLMTKARVAGEMDALTALYQGEQTARDLTYAGQLGLAAGEAAKSASQIGMASSILGGAGSLYGSVAGNGGLSSTSLTGSYTRPNAALRGTGGTLGGGV